MTLEAYWPLTGTSGDVYDYSGNNRYGETRNGVTRGIDGPLGQNAFSFDGADDYVALHDSFSSSSALDELTVNLWYRTSASSPDWAFLDYDRSEYFSFGFDVSGGTDLRFATNSGGVHDLYTGTGFADGSWHMATAVYDGMDKYIYVDAVEEASTSNAHGGDPLGSGTTRYGFLGDGSEASSFDGSRNSKYYEGDLAEVRYYSRALSLSEIYYLYEVGARGQAVTNTKLIDEA